MNHERDNQAPYDDPLGVIWLETARRCGLAIVRTDDVYASYDGAGTLSICNEEHFDPDDCVAQMVLHELCHALIMGPSALNRPDWGLENVDDRHTVHEHACVRLQATLTDRHGLREVLAPTTNFRAYYDALGADPLALGEDPAIERAIEGWDLARHGAWAGPIEDALRATRAIAEAVTGCGAGVGLWAQYRRPHRLGLPPGSSAATCGACAWSSQGDGDSLACGLAQRALGERAPAVGADELACRFHEPELTINSCGACGACCREAYHEVPVGSDEPLRTLRPDLMTAREGLFSIARPQGQCEALERDNGANQRFRCQVYDQRPQHCRDFELGGANCLEARQRVGLSGRPR